MMQRFGCLSSQLVRYPFLWGKDNKINLSVMKKKECWMTQNNNLSPCMNLFKKVLSLVQLSE